MAESFREGALADPELLGGFDSGLAFIDLQEKRLTMRFAQSFEDILDTLLRLAASGIEGGAGLGAGEGIQQQRSRGIWIRGQAGEWPRPFRLSTVALENLEPQDAREPTLQAAGAAVFKILDTGTRLELSFLQQVIDVMRTSSGGTTNAKFGEHPQLGLAPLQQLDPGLGTGRSLAPGVGKQMFGRVFGRRVGD